MTNTFADLPAETVLAVCDRLGGDGHGLYDPAFLTELGVPDELVLSVTTTYKSDGTYKGSMWDNEGNLIPEQTCVYSLALYRRISRDLGLPGSQMGGRGFEARDLNDRIHKALTEAVKR